MSGCSGDCRCSASSLILAPFLVIFSFLSWAGSMCSDGIVELSKDGSPTIALRNASSAFIARIARGFLRDILRQDYIRTGSPRASKRPPSLSTQSERDDPGSSRSSAQSRRLDTGSFIVNGVPSRDWGCLRRVGTHSRLRRDHGITSFRATVIAVMNRSRLALRRCRSPNSGWREGQDMASDSTLVQPLISPSNRSTQAARTLGPGRATAHAQPARTRLPRFCSPSSRCFESLRKSSLRFSVTIRRYSNKTSVNAEPGSEYWSARPPRPGPLGTAASGHTVLPETRHRHE